MDSATRDALARILADERARTEAALRAHDAALEGLGAARGDATADDEHDPEGATLADEWSRLTGLRAAAVRELEELDAARARLADGTYGVCEVCGRAIPLGRLEVRPTATRCVACAS
ncbi:molecular chaperone DnaK [Microbacterium sp. MEC084]|uniref:TraR/DksA family transcriptional regulator n=1 Tax=Microbacterium sp. MEC084 TaxID=1963027 RepID=UPI00106F29D0|nr:TraR/DksA C4-type zinc finger protein [Microbacterium sp. MEC084]MCD1269602.1 molecular chaperone DnaK [Microbacterium sp. MEC084]